MSFASRADLLARSNARRLAQLAVPADVAMPRDDALRAAINDEDLTAYTIAEQDALQLALDTMDKCLADADALILSYDIPATVQTSLLARIASTIALYYLQGVERMTDELNTAYKDCIGKLEAHKQGKQNLIPPAPDAPVIEGDVIVVESAGSRYGTSSTDIGDW